MKQNLIKVNGSRITDAGIIAKVIHETPTRVKVEVVYLFFPLHKKVGFNYQVDKDRQEFLRGRIIGQTLSFWKTGTRADFEVGGDRVVVNWDLLEGE